MIKPTNSKEYAAAKAKEPKSRKSTGPVTPPAVEQPEAELATPQLIAAAPEPPTAPEVPVAPAPKERVKTRVDRETCAAARKDMSARGTITDTGKVDTSRPGSLRANIVAAVRSSATVVDACKKEVFGAPGTKHENLAYRIKKVDVGFAVGNGFITVAE